MVADRPFTPGFRMSNSNAVRDRHTKGIVFFNISPGKTDPHQPKFSLTYRQVGFHSVTVVGIYSLKNPFDPNCFSRTLQLTAKTAVKNPKCIWCRPTWRRRMCRI